MRDWSDEQLKNKRLELESQLNEIESIERERRVAAEAIIDTRIAEIHKGDFTRAFEDKELRYALHARCSCGAKYAYPRKISMRGAWYCSSILKGEEAALTVVHERELPFMFFDVKAEPDVTNPNCEVVNDD